jgi:hypothetical protein
LSTWRQFCFELPAIFDLKIPRHIPVIDQRGIQLLGFADASIEGYAATVYLRIFDNFGLISVKFITCKTKVAPVKSVATNDSLSIPRLELCGALLLAQTLHHIYSILSSERAISRLRAWSDSSIVLSWLTSYQKYFKIFVTNRVVKIHQLIPDREWDHVSTTDNPADPASPGLLPRSTLSSDIYWNGPVFLRLLEEQWPKSQFSPLSLDQLPEHSSKVITTLTINVKSPPFEVFNRFSSLNKMQRVLSFVFRFLDRLRRLPICSGPVTFMERDTMLSVVIRQTQLYYFSELFKILETRSTVTPPSMAQLAPHVDNKGVIRVGGRLCWSDARHDAKYLILLPRSLLLTELLIRHCHLSFIFGGPKLILSMLNQKFWILFGRAAVRQVIFSCVPCTRH